MRHSRRPQPRGFTLIESMVVIGIVGVVTALSFSGYSGMKERADARNGIREVLGVLRVARAESFSRGVPTVFHLRDVDGELVYGAVVDLDGDFDPADIEGSLEEDDRVLAAPQVARGVSFRDATSDVFDEPLVQPYARVPADAPCTFCTDDGQLVVRFRSDGRPLFGEAPDDHPQGGSFALVTRPMKNVVDGTPVDARTIVILAQAGTVVDFDR